MSTKCDATVSDPPWHVRRRACRLRAVTKVGSVSVCKVHAKIARRWKSQGRLEEMIKYWWKGKS